MNQLEKRQTSLELLGVTERAVTKASPDVRANVEARKDFPVRSLLPTEIRPRLAKAIETAANNLGQKNSDVATIKAILDQVPSELARAYFNWTLAEVEHAISLGSLGQLSSDTVHLSAKNVITWLNLYNEKHRKPAFAYLKRLSAEKDESNTNTPKKKELTGKGLKKALNDTLREYREGKIKAPAFAYDLFKREKLVEIPKDETWQYIRQAQKAVIEEAQEMRRNPILKHAAKRRLDDALLIKDQDIKSVPLSVVNKVKELRLIEFFRTLPKNHKFE